MLLARIFKKPALSESVVLEFHGWPIAGRLGSCIVSWLKCLPCLGYPC